MSDSEDETMKDANNKRGRDELDLDDNQTQVNVFSSPRSSLCA